MKPIWYSPVSIEEIQKWAHHPLLEILNIQFTELGANFLSACMPIDARTHQPFGSLHGGATCYLAETVGSVAANFCVNPVEKYCVGLEINANHIKSIQSGQIIASARPLHLGQSTQIWDIQMRNNQNALIAVSRLTLAVLRKNNENLSK